jgi:iron complex transport system permease protein
MRSEAIKWIIITVVLLLCLLIAIGISLTIGELNISLFDLPDILKNGEGSIEYIIVSNIRIPRVILGIAVGGALSLSGVILQGIYRNPLVEPYTLGISGGAALGVAIAIVFGLHYSLGSFILPLLGFAGALITIVFVYIISIKQGQIRIQNMLLIGVMLSFIASSAMMLLMAITSRENLHGIVFWIMGSLDEPNRNLIWINLIVALIGLVLSYLFVRPLNALRLGEEKARHLGINTNVSIKLLFIIASLLAGVSVAVAGVIGFVGLVIPHVMRFFVGPDNRILLIASFIGGSAFLILCDSISRVLIMPNELPIGVITGIVGGLVFILILSRKTIKFN